VKIRFRGICLRIATGGGKGSSTPSLGGEKEYREKKSLEKGNTMVPSNGRKGPGWSRQIGGGVKRNQA